MKFINVTLNMLRYFQFISFKVPILIIMDCLFDESMISS